MRRLVTLAIVLAVSAPLSACGGSSLPTAKPIPPSPSQKRLAAMRRAVATKDSVHSVSLSSAQGHTVAVIADVGADEGIQRISVRDGRLTGSGTAIVNGRTLFMRGDAFALEQYFDLPKAQATKYAGRWISVPASNPAFTNLSDGMTFPSYVSHLFPPETQLSLVKAGKLIGVRGTVHGQGGATASATLIAPAHGTPLPIREVAGSGAGNGIVTMSRWGEPVHVPKPKAAVPIAVVFHRHH